MDQEVPVGTPPAGTQLAHKPLNGLLISDLNADVLRAFLRHIEEKRKCSIASRNQRLAAVHALAGFISERCPEHLEWCAHLRTIRAKRSAPVPVCYLEKQEIDALLDTPSSVTEIGRRDRALLLFLYNTGARADEAANVCIDDLNLHSGADRSLSSVRLNGKGGKVRICPLWASTTQELMRQVAGRDGAERVFLNRSEEPLTRFGIHDIVTRHMRVAMKRVPEMRKKRIGPHTIRHTTATHLLRAGVGSRRSKAAHVRLSSLCGFVSGLGKADH